jgi:hypothetical protein
MATCLESCWLTAVAIVSLRRTRSHISQHRDCWPSSRILSNHRSMKL